MNTVILVLLLIALIAAAVDLWRSHGYDLTAWGVVLLAIVGLLGRL